MTCPLFVPATARTGAKLKFMTGIQCDTDGADADFRRRWESYHRRAARDAGAISCCFRIIEPGARSRGLCPKLRLRPASDPCRAYEFTFARAETLVILEWLSSVQTMEHWMSPPVEMWPDMIDPWSRWTLAADRERELATAGFRRVKGAAVERAPAPPVTVTVPT